MKRKGGVVSSSARITKVVARTPRWFWWRQGGHAEVRLAEKWDPGRRCGQAASSLALALAPESGFKELLKLIKKVS